MSAREIALQITLKAMEEGMLCTFKFVTDKEEELEGYNKTNAKQISDFYNAVFKSIEVHKGAK